jgi:hypothetical protein
MAVDAPAELTTFGRKLASAQGFDPDTPGFDAVDYGRAARYAMSRKPPHAVPDPREFVVGGAPAATPHRLTGLTDSPRRTVRIGQFEIGMREEPPARHRPQHPRHVGERSSGRYRLTHRNPRARYRKPKR